MNLDVDFLPLSDHEDMRVAILHSIAECFRVPPREKPWRPGEPAAGER